MVAKRRRAKQETEAERLDRLLYSVPISDEDPTVFWGSTIVEEIAAALQEHAANPGIIYEDGEAFLRALKELALDDADV